MITNMALLTGDVSAASGIMSFLPSILLFGALIYFMIIRPQKKRQQSAKDLMSSLNVGDIVQTIGGFVGEIIAVENDEFVIVSEETKLRIKKNAVAIRINPNVVEQTQAETVKTSTEDDDEEFNIEDFEI